MLRLPNGARLEGDHETVYSAVDGEQAGGDGLYTVDIVEATGLPADRVRAALAGLLDQDALSVVTSDDELGDRYVRGRATG